VYSSNFNISAAVETELAPRSQTGVCKGRKLEGMEWAVAKDLGAKRWKQGGAQTSTSN